MGCLCQSYGKSGVPYPSGKCMVCGEQCAEPIPPPKNCPWWIRWYHRRLRGLDVLYLLPVIEAKVMRQLLQWHTWQQSPLIVSDGDMGVFMKNVDAAFDLHKRLPGNEHWRCACAHAEGVGVIQ